MPTRHGSALDWDKLRVFHAVADAGSFTHAGETLNLSQSAVSRQISALEDSLQCTLFHRHARGLLLTEQGELLYNTVHDVFSKLAMVEGQLSESREHPQGPLKINVPMAMGSVWMTPRLREFLDMYPDISISLVLDDSELDLSMREADVAIRVTPPRQPDLIQRQLMTLQYNVYAAPEYLKKYGMPKKVDDLRHHRLIVYGRETRLPTTENVNWLMTDAGGRGALDHAPIELNNVYGIYRAVQAGLGIAALPEYFIMEPSTNLVRILPEMNGPRMDVFFVYPEELRASKRIHVFRDFLIKKIGKHRL